MSKISGSRPGVSLMRNTLSHSLSRRAHSPVCRGMASGWSWRPFPSTLAARGQLTLSKASKSVVRIFTARQPSITFRSKARNTPAAPEAAMARAVRRFSMPSLKGWAMGSWAPVSTTGMAMPRSMKERTEAV